MTANDRSKPFSVKIPPDLVEKLSLKAGDRVRLAVADDGTLLVKTPGAKAVARVSTGRGRAAKPGRSPRAKAR